MMRSLSRVGQPCDLGQRRIVHPQPAPPSASCINIPSADKQNPHTTLSASLPHINTMENESPDGYQRNSQWADSLTSSPSEYVLRGSKSFAARSWRSRASIASRATSGKENRSTTNDSDHDRPAAAPVARAVPVLGRIASNNQLMRPPGPYKPGPSPTPSLRKKKIESLVKAHGSPDHVRVTAGGRIVPSEQSPLCHPRYGYSAVKVNGGLIKFAPNHPMGKAQWTQATQNGFVAQDVNGRLCQIVDGTILPLHETEEGLQLYIPAPNLNITQRASPAGCRSAGPARFTQQQPPASLLPEPSLTSQLNALEIEYSKLEHELKDVDKTEVLHGRTMGKGAKDALIAKRRELVMSLDRIRKALRGLREQVAAGISPSLPPNQCAKPSVSTPQSRLPAFLQRQNPAVTHAPAPPASMLAPVYALQQPSFPAPFGFPQTTPSPDTNFLQPWAMPPPGLFVPPPSFDGSMSSTSLPFPPPMEAFLAGLPAAHAHQPPMQPAAEIPTHGSTLPLHDGSRSFSDLQRVDSLCKPHELAIKPDTKPALKSNLNPMSPVYKPGAGLPQQRKRSQEMKAANEDKSPASSPLRQLQESTGSLKFAKTTNISGNCPMKASATLIKAHVQSSSVSSFETVDFFPKNTAEYSTRKYTTAAPLNLVEANGSVAKENRDPPATPAKDLHTHSHPTMSIPAAPPGTPIDGLPDREKHNMSPKGRNWRFIEELPSQLDTQATPSPEKPSSPLMSIAAAPAQAFDDLTGKSQAWLEGYYAGRAAPRSNSEAGDLLSRPASAVVSATSLGSSRLSFPPAAGRIFSGLFGQIDGWLTFRSRLRLPLLIFMLRYALPPATWHQRQHGRH